MGYWMYDNEEFTTKQDMWEYLRDTQYCYDTIDIERWVNDVYAASQILWKFRDALEDGHSIDTVMLDIYDEYEQDEWWDEVGDPEEGEDFDYNGFLFKWVDEEEDLQ